MIGFIIAGLVIGALARLIKPGKQNLSLLMTLLLGLAGSVIGGVIASLLGTGDIWELNILGFVFAVIAAVLLIGVAEGMSSKKSHDRLTPASAPRRSRCATPQRRRSRSATASCGANPFASLSK